MSALGHTPSTNANSYFPFWEAELAHCPIIIVIFTYCGGLKGGIYGPSVYGGDTMPPSLV